MEIQFADRSHVPGMTEIWEEFMEYHAKINPYFAINKNARAEWMEFLDQHLDSDRSAVLVALEDGRVVGLVVGALRSNPPYFVSREYGLIDSLAVAESRRRQGIGKALLLRLLDWFGEQGMKRTHVGVLSDNRAGYAFWKKYGFKDYLHMLYLADSE